MAQESVFNVFGLYIAESDISICISSGCPIALRAPLFSQHALRQCGLNKRSAFCFLTDTEPTVKALLFYES